MDHMNFQMAGDMPPSIAQQPPQIFGGYPGPDGLHLPPDIAAQMFPDTHMLYDDSQEAKRRRIARVSNQTWTARI